METFPKTLLQLAAERDCSPGDIVEFVPVTRQAVWMWMNGIARPSPYHRQRLLIQLACEPAELDAALEETARQRKVDA